MKSSLIFPVQLPERKADEPGNEVNQRQNDICALQPEAKKPVPVITFLDNTIRHVREDFSQIINSIDHQWNRGGKGVFERYV